MAGGRDDILAEAAGIEAGAWFAWPSTHVGHELIAAGMLIMAGGHDGKPLDFDGVRDGPSWPNRMPLCPCPTSRVRQPLSGETAPIGSEVDRRLLACGVSCHRSLGPAAQYFWRAPLQSRENRRKPGASSALATI
jgi:hypothetical protein